MFDTIALAPPDPIVGINDAFKSDPRAEKMNLSIGIYQDADGNTPVLASVKKAEQRILAGESTKRYLAIEGLSEFAAHVQQLLFGSDHEIVTGSRAATVHTPGGTGALRLAADFLKKTRGGITVWLSDPTWANHASIFQAAGLSTKSYPYYDPRTHGLAFDSMIDALKGISARDVVVLHATCHNPTGVDATPEQWGQIADVLEQREAVPLIDFAYQGFGEGLAEDAAGLRKLCGPGRSLMICSSFSKNFGLYNERVGALTVVAPSSEIAQRVLSHVKLCARANYSFPPAHGGYIVVTILSDSDLRVQWADELTQMRDRIQAMRRHLARTLTAKGIVLGAGGGNAFIVRQHGMFGFSGLGESQVRALRDRHAIYMVASGRINVAGLNYDKIDRLCSAIADVL